MSRYFSDVPIESDRVQLTGSEHQHLSKVMRHSVGDEVTLFDGTGWEYQATIAETGRQSTSLEVTERAKIDRELGFGLHLGVALPKGDRQQFVVEKLVELGVTALTPLVTHRGVAQPGEKAMSRMQRWIISASKQCRRNVLMQVSPSQTPSDFFESSSGTSLIAHPGLGVQLRGVVNLCKGSICNVAIGPEGGFTEQEVQAAIEKGATPFSLGERILRVETAAIAVVASLVFGI